MPLTNAQMEFIKGSISHLFEFPADKETLSADIAQFNHWIKHPPANPDDNNLYHLLARCLRSPETAFQHLEDYGTNATTQEVQEYLLSLITAELQTAAASANISLADIGWDTAATTALISHEHSTAVFTSIKIKHVMTLPWENIQDDNGFHSACLFFNDAHTHVLIKTSFTLPGKTEPGTIIEELEKIPGDGIDDYEYNFLERLIPYAKKVARSCVASAVIEELKRNAPGVTGNLN